MARADANEAIVATALAATRLTGGLAASGAAVLSGVQLAKLGELHDLSRVALAAIATLVAIAAILYGVLLAVRVMLPSRVSLADLCAREADRERAGLPQHSARVQTLLQSGGYASVSALDSAYREALERRHQALLDNQADPDDKRVQRRANEAIADTAGLNDTIGTLLRATQAEGTVSAYRHATRRLPFVVFLLVGGIVGAIAAANASEPAPVDLRGADLTGIVLRDARLRSAVLDGMQIAHADLRGTYLGNASIDRTSWVDTLCPDGVNSDNAGKTCAGHLEP